jgi:hypothetical protein
MKKSIWLMNTLNFRLTKYGVFWITYLLVYGTFAIFFPKFLLVSIVISLYFYIFLKIAKIPYDTELWPKGDFK